MSKPEGSFVPNLSQLKESLPSPVDTNNDKRPKNFIPSPVDMYSDEQLQQFLPNRENEGTNLMVTLPKTTLNVDKVIECYSVPPEYQDIAKKVFDLVSRGKLVCASRDGISVATMSGYELVPAEPNDAYVLHEICTRAIRLLSRGRENGKFNTGIRLTVNELDQWWNINCGETEGTPNQKVFARTSQDETPFPLHNYGELVFACVAATEGIGPNIYAASVYNNMLTMVMEDSGEDLVYFLQKVIDTDQESSTSEACVQVGVSLATQIGHLSRLGICHTDLKIENVVVDSTDDAGKQVWHAKIIDYDPKFVYFSESTEQQERGEERSCIELLNLTMMLLGFLCNVWNHCYEVPGAHMRVFEVVRPLYERFDELRATKTVLCDAVKKIKTIEHARRKPVIPYKVAEQIVFKAKGAPENPQHQCMFDLGKDGYFVQMMEQIDRAWSNYGTD